MIRTDRDQERRRSQRQGSNYFLLTGLVVWTDCGFDLFIGVFQGSLGGYHAREFDSSR